MFTQTHSFGEDMLRCWLFGDERFRKNAQYL